jgi:ribosome-associated translation inhibitor RaiA
MRAWQALTQVHLGRWCAAAAMATEVLHRRSVSVMSRLTVRVAQGRLRARGGDADVYAALDEALALATRADNMQRRGRRRPGSLVTMNAPDKKRGRYTTSPCASSIPG